MPTYPFAWDDPFLLNEQLSEEELLIQSAARDFAQEKLMPAFLKQIVKNDFIEK